MNNISLFKPIVLMKSLEDMKEAQKEQATRFLTNKDIITIDETGFAIKKLDAIKNTLPQIYYVGSEAVCIYRQMLGLPYVGINTIDVDEIIMDIADYDTLYDILYFIQRVDTRNKRIIGLKEMGVPPIILWNEYIMLRQAVENLQDNNWCGNPIVNSFDVPNEEGTSDHYDEVRKSLADIHYDLTLECGYEPECDDEE